ncbi:MAG: sigma 54-interacting transcriptional regulator [Syntrophales bacterium]|nr:sigma 54-interacting transcriptional regulator [Syntrophales bacterium]
MSIIFIAPEHEIAETYRRVLSNVWDRVQVVEALMNEAVTIARDLEARGAEVFVARGGTSRWLISEGIKVPIVEMHMTSGDLVQALSEAKSMSHSEQPFIAVVAFPNMLQNLLDFEPFLNVRLSCYRLDIEKDVENLIKAAVAEGAQVILGGAVTTQAAKSLGLPAVLLRTGESSIRQAYEEAQRIVYARKLEASRSNELKAILEYSYEGIIAVNSNDYITVFNPVAQSVTGLSQEQALGQLSNKVIPSICLTEALEGGNEDIGQIIDFGRSKVMINRIPIRVSGEIVGAVATFQDVTRIQSLETRIRREIYSKGHVAKFSLEDIRGSSSVLARTVETANRYAQVDSTVLIHGETGVGKELFAQGIHRASSRTNGPFVAVNCAALPENLLESELFGYVEGAFTGAVRKGKPGLFELAHHGTIFLDEVSEIPFGLQGRLLRVLQEREVVRLGHDRIIPVDVRVLCATNQELNRLVAEGRYRKDLYWRLNVLSLAIPPLRERTDDILLLLSDFLPLLHRGDKKKIVFTQHAADFLTRYPWPGNVRELNNFCERLVAVVQGGEVDEALVKRILEYSEPIQLSYNKQTDFRDVERALTAADGKVGQAAQILGVHRATLWRRRKRILSLIKGKS